MRHRRHTTSLQQKWYNLAKQAQSYSFNVSSNPYPLPCTSEVKDNDFYLRIITKAKHTSWTTPSPSPATYSKIEHSIIKQEMIQTMPPYPLPSIRPSFTSVSPHNVKSLANSTIPLLVYNVTYNTNFD